MKTSIIIWTLSALATGHPTTTLSKRQSGSGSGPYPAAYTTDPTLPNHTIYRPNNPSALKVPAPVLVWGNGGCSANGLSQKNFLMEIASWGFLVLASGGPNASGSTTAKMMTESIDWATKTAGTGSYEKVDAKRIAAAGFSCGGIEAYDNVNDTRIGAIGIFNSGQLSEDGTKNIVAKIKKPIFFFLGGEKDIAYANGLRDYKALAEGTPSWMGNLPVGHGATYSDVNGGKFGKAAQLWLRWVLMGEASVNSFFTGDGAKADGWTVESKSLDKLVPL